MDTVELISEAIAGSDNIVAFTGAGASTESNIPDFRSSKGLYGNNANYPYPPETMLSHSFFEEHTGLFYDYYRNNMVYKEAAPNDCHYALAELEKLGKLKAVVTQNIDGLHQTAGSANVLELHGSVYRNYCMSCGKFYDLDYMMGLGEKIPGCTACKGIVKPDVVLYEENLDKKTIEKSIEFISRADVLLIIGTSLVVYPAAGFIDYYRGNKLILINKSATQYDGRAKYVVNESAGKVMRQVINRLGY